MSTLLCFLAIEVRPPIQQAVLMGDKESGITTMRMAEGLDTGDILVQDKLNLEPGETAESLFLK